MKFISCLLLLVTFSAVKADVAGGDLSGTSWHIENSTGHETTFYLIDEQLEDVDFDITFDVYETATCLGIAQELIMPLVLAGVNCFDSIKQYINNWYLYLNQTVRK